MFKGGGKVQHQKANCTTYPHLGTHRGLSDSPIPQSARGVSSNPFPTQTSRLWDCMPSDAPQVNLNEIWQSPDQLSFLSEEDLHMRGLVQTPWRSHMYH